MFSLASKMLISIDIDFQTSILFNILNRLHEFPFPQKQFRRACYSYCRPGLLPKIQYDAHEFLWTWTYISIRSRNYCIIFWTTNFSLRGINFHLIWFTFRYSTDILLLFQEDDVCSSLHEIPCNILPSWGYINDPSLCSHDLICILNFLFAIW